jgi:hypothetical protein
MKLSFSTPDGTVYAVETDDGVSIADVIGPIVSDQMGKSDTRGPAELRATLHLDGLSLEEVRKLQGETVVILIANPQT